MKTLNVKNTAAQLCEVNGMLAQFPVPDNTPRIEDDLCRLLYQMVKHNWCNALCNSGRIQMDMSLEYLVDYLEQIKFLEVVKQKSKTVVVDDDISKREKLISHCNKNTKHKANAKGKVPINLKG
eukprot:5558631-Ditylum_brightwellii.AAC.1